MAVEPIDMGVAKTTALPNRDITNVSDASSVALRGAVGYSAYSLPYIRMTNSTQMMEASRQQSELIAQARARFEEMMRQQQQAQAGWLSQKAGTVLGGFLNDLGQGFETALGQAGNIGTGFLNDIGQGFEESFGKAAGVGGVIGSGLIEDMGQGFRSALSPIVTFPERAPEVTKPREISGFTLKPIYDQNKNISGYEYVRNDPVPPSQSLGTPGTNAAGLDAAEINRMKERLNSDDMISILEKTAGQRYDNEVRRIWGDPKVEYIDPKNPSLGIKSINYQAAYGKDYIGMTPGTLRMVAVEPLPENATEQQKQEYLNKLRTQIRPPQYTYTGLNSVLFKMSSTDLKNMQRGFLAAKLYDPKTPVVFGRITTDEKTILANLMEVANLNGTTWQYELAQAQDYVKQNPQAFGGGGGGGGTPANTVYTQVNYSQTSMAQGRELLTRVLQDALGRNPTESEMSAFIDMLNAAERQSPTTSVTRTHRMGKSATRSETTTTPSTVDAAQMATEFAKQIGGGDEFRENRAQHYLDLIAGQYNYGFGQA